MILFHLLEIIFPLIFLLVLGMLKSIPLENQHFWIV